MDRTLGTQRLVLMPILESEPSTFHGIFVDSFVRKYLCDGNIFSWQRIEEMLHQGGQHFACG
jgi:[ribosomal protein S5]-alanine N-acetyltransferase